MLHCLAPRSLPLCDLPLSPFALSHSLSSANIPTYEGGGGRQSGRLISDSRAQTALSGERQEKKREAETPGREKKRLGVRMNRGGGDTQQIVTTTRYQYH